MAISKKEIVAAKFNELEAAGVTPQDLLAYSQYLTRKRAAEREAQLLPANVPWPNLNQNFMDAVRLLADNPFLEVGADWSVPLELAQQALLDNDSSGFVKGLVLLFLSCHRQRRPVI